MNTIREPNEKEEAPPAESLDAPEVDINSVGASEKAFPIWIFIAGALVLMALLAGMVFFVKNSAPFLTTAKKEDIPSALLLLNDIYEKGFDGHNFIVGLADHFRNLLVCKDVRTASLLEVGENIEQKYIDQSKQLDAHIILRSLAILSKSDVDYKSSKNQRLLVEMALMQLCSLNQELEKKNG
jgi:hypothetical protein